MRRILTFMMFTCFVALCGYGWAANYSNPVDGIFKGSYGDTVVVEVPNLVSKSPDELSSGDLTFQVNSNTGYSNFNQLVDLHKGDRVQVAYSDQPDSKMKKMIATMITKVSSATTETTAGTQSVTTTTTTTVNPSAQP